jgi:hypothetical protein
VWEWPVRTTNKISGTDWIHLGHAADQSLDSSAATGTGIRLHKWEIGVRFPAEERESSLFYSIQTGSDTNPALSNGYSKLLCEVQRQKCEELTTHLCQVRRLSMRGVIPPLSHSSAWCSAWYNVRLYMIQRDSNGFCVACRYGVPGVLSTLRSHNGIFSLKLVYWDLWVKFTWLFDLYLCNPTGAQWRSI